MNLFSVPFCSYAGKPNFPQMLERMAGTTRLELATSAVTVSGLQVLSTTWKSTDGTASHWKYVVDNVIVYRDVYRAGQAALRLWTAFYRPFLAVSKALFFRNGWDSLQCDLLRENLISYGWSSALIARRSSIAR